MEGGSSLRSLRTQLLNLAAGELAAAGVSCWLYLSLRAGNAALAGFSSLVFVLLQGSTYWVQRYIVLLKRRSLSTKSVALWRVLRWLNIGLLGIAGLVIFIQHSGCWDLCWGLAAFLFAIVEYINYFWYRLSYGRSGFNVRLLLKKGLHPSSINRMIKRKESFSWRMGARE